MVCSYIYWLHVALSRQTTKYEEGSLVVHLQPQPGKSISDKLKKVCCLIREDRCTCGITHFWYVALFITEH